MDFIASTFVRLWMGGMLALALLGCVLLFNLVSHVAFAGPVVDTDFTVTQYLAAWGIMYLVTFILEPS